MRNFKKLKGKKRKLLVSLLLFWFLKVNQVKGAPLPGAEGFSPTYRCRKRETYSREATDLSTRLKENSNNQNIPRKNKDIYNRCIPEFGCIMEDLQVQKKFKHAGDFEVLGNPNRENFELLLFKDKMAEHMIDSSTIIKHGTYKKYRFKSNDTSR